MYYCLSGNPKIGIWIGCGQCKDVVYPKHGDDLKMKGLFFREDMDDARIDHSLAQPEMGDPELFPQKDHQFFI